jgi:K+/H+ antiporter YhaU regulatory subunit KhtT
MSARSASLASAAGLPDVREVRLRPGPLADTTVRDAQIRERFGVTIVAITHPDGSLVVNPPADTILRAGDRLRVFGLPAQIESLAAAADSVGRDDADGRRCG